VIGLIHLQFQFLIDFQFLSKLFITVLSVPRHINSIVGRTAYSVPKRRCL
jgi:hypothetical protein